MIKSISKPMKRAFQGTNKVPIAWFKDPNGNILSVLEA